MPRYKQYLEIDVLTAAKQRIEHILDTHDTPVVLFSGGKDSLVVLHLVLEAVKARGATALDVVFRDEELLPDSVIDFVKSYYDRPDIRMIWFGVPMLSQKFILGHSQTFVQWDPDREWVRPKPEWAYIPEDGGREVYHQKSMDHLVAGMFPGKVALINGIRAAESLVRYRSCVNKLDENYINKSSCPTATFCKPIYDWSEDDIFKFLYDEGIPYCTVYDSQVLSGGRLRVATPLVCEGAKQIEKLRVQDPDFYDRIMRIFPESGLNRYWQDYDTEAVIRQYGRTYIGVRRWILANLDPSHKKKALGYLQSAMAMLKERPYAYHPVYLLKWAMGGRFDRMPIPMTVDEHKAMEAKYARPD